MKKRFNKYFPYLFILGELIVLTTIFFISLYVAFGSFNLIKPYSYALLIYLCCWPVLSYFNKDYKIGRAVSYYSTFKKAFASVFIFVSLISLLWIFIAEEQEVDRHFMMALVLFLFVWLTIYRVFVHLVLDRYRTFGGNIRYAAIVGYDKLGFGLYDLFRRKPHYGIRCEGIYSEKLVTNKRHKYPHLGLLDKVLESGFRKYDFIYLSDNLSREVKNEIVRVADEYAKKVKLLPEIKTDVLKTFVLRRYDSISVIDINRLPLDSLANRLSKRLFDILFSSFVIVLLLSWMYPLFALIIKLESKGPVFFKQWREGKDGEHFLCWKFRTMVLNEEADIQWASKDDPRTTKFGTFLRKTSLDEFPQFLNVIVGQMSVVGPRPHPISLNNQYKESVQKFAKRHESKPGVTGLAQAMGYRGEITDYHQMSSRVKLDRFYLQNWSFVLDLKIIFLTIFGIARGQEKAY